MTPSQIAFVDEILAGNRTWEEFAQEYEQPLRNYLLENGIFDPAEQERLLAAGFISFQEKYEQSALLIDSIFVKEPVSVRLQPVEHTLKQGILAELIESVCAEVVKRKVATAPTAWKISRAELRQVYETIQLILENRNAKANPPAAPFAFEKSYLHDRAIEQILIHRIRQGDTQALMELETFTWLGTSQSGQMLTKFVSRIKEGIRKVFGDRKDKDDLYNRLVHSDGGAFIEKAKEYIWEKLAPGTTKQKGKSASEATVDTEEDLDDDDDEELENRVLPSLISKPVTASLMTFIQDFTYSEKNGLHRGKLPNFITRKKTQSDFGYTYERPHSSKKEQEIKPKKKPSSRTYTDDVLRRSEDYLDYKDAVEKAFNQLEPHCKVKVLYHDKAMAELEVLSDEEPFMEFMEHTFVEKAKEGWPLEGREPPNEGFNKESFRSQCSQCYSKFKCTLYRLLGRGQER